MNPNIYNFSIKSVSIGSKQVDSTGKDVKFFGHVTAVNHLDINKVVEADFFVDVTGKYNDYQLVDGSCSANFDVDDQFKQQFLSECLFHAGWKMRAMDELRSINSPKRSIEFIDKDISDALTSMKLTAIQISDSKQGQAMSKFCDKVFKQMQDQKRNDDDGFSM